MGGIAFSTTMFGFQRQSSGYGYSLPFISYTVSSKLFCAGLSAPRGKGSSEGEWPFTQGCLFILGCRFSSTPLDWASFLFPLRHSECQPLPKAEVHRMSRQTTAFVCEIRSSTLNGSRSSCFLRPSCQREELALHQSFL